YELRLFDPQHKLVRTDHCATIGELGRAMRTVGDELKAGVHDEILDEFGEVVVELYAIEGAADRALTDREQAMAFATATEWGAVNLGNDDEALAEARTGNPNARR